MIYPPLDEVELQQLREVGTAPNKPQRGPNRPFRWSISGIPNYYSMLNFLIYDVSTQPRLIGVPTYDIGKYEVVLYENKLDAKTEYEQYIKNKNILEFDKILDIDNLLTKNESTAYDELVTDITDPSFYFILAQSDFQPTPHDDCQARQQNIKLIRQDIKRMIDKYDNKTFEEVFYMPDTVDKLDKNKVYDQETSSEFREVHPNSYRNWYSRCCQHEYQTECYIPLVCGKTRFCGNLDSGSTCSVLSMTVANKLFKEGTLKKLYDTKINLVGAGGIS
ncbi:unnamed protein product [Rotaria magnacalcarata]|uniref:Uncharacterized protein n=1 Tax=Rotaria magnacalcarata TaxID=392030 RepID=A0A820M856_9BILA|nr:unnamed protein product [Rotaria magnacalcarata]